MDIIGGMAKKIKNNIKEQDQQQFSWKIAFPKDVKVGDINLDGIVLLTSKLKRLRCEFAIYKEANAILVSPQTPYRPGQLYFFWAKYSGKDLCVAFIISEDGRMQAFDNKTSILKLNEIHKNEEMKAAEKATKIVRVSDQSATDYVDE